MKYVNLSEIFSMGVLYLYTDIYISGRDLTVYLCFYYIFRT